MRAKTVRPLRTDVSDRFPKGVMPPGTIDDGPESYRLVQCGVAVPDDEECRLKAGMSDEQMAQQQQAAEARSLGILPEDWDAFHRGELIGYDDAGRWIPGPNFCGSLEDYESTADELSDESL